MYEVFITTIAVKQFSSEEIKDIVQELSARNISHGITGVLIYNNGEFYQILEGEKDTICNLMDSIKEDERHGSVHTIWEGEIPERGYKNWGLAPCMMSQFSLDTT